MRGVTYHHFDTFFDELLIDVAQKEWEKQLTPFIPEQIPIEKVLKELQFFTQQLWQRGK